MDPFSLLNLSLEDIFVGANDDMEPMDISDLTSYSPRGDWTISSDDYYIIYDHVKYSVIRYNHDTNKISFFGDMSDVEDGVVPLPSLVLQLGISEINAKKSNIDIIEHIVEIIDDSKEKLTDMSYMNIMDFLKTQYNSNL
jgi:hypothetical protein